MHAASPDDADCQNIMKILYFHQHFSTPSGSTGTRSYEMARRLVERGHEVTMICGSYAHGQTGLDLPFTKGRRRGQVDGIEVIEYDLAYGNADGFLKRSITFLKFSMRSIVVALTEPADLVFATSTPLTAGIPGIAAKLLRRKPFVFEVRDLWPELPRAMGVITNPVILWAMSVLEWLSYRTADQLIGLSPGIVDGIAARGVPKDRIAMIPNGCDLDMFNAASPDAGTAGWRPEGVGPDDIMAIFTGTHGVANGLDALINVAIELKSRNVEHIKLVLVGDGKEKPILMAKANSLNLQSQLIFCDPVPKTELAGLMTEASLGLQILANVPAFYFGTSPNKFFDYLSASLPVLINYPGWLTGLVVEYDAGCVVAPDDPFAFADALVQLDPIKLKRQGENARKLGQDNFDRNRFGDVFVSTLEQTGSRA